MNSHPKFKISPEFDVPSRSRINVQLQAGSLGDWLWFPHRRRIPKGGIPFIKCISFYISHIPPCLLRETPPSPKVSPTSIFVHRMHGETFLSDFTFRSLLLLLLLLKADLVTGCSGRHRENDKKGERESCRRSRKAWDHQKTGGDKYKYKYKYKQIWKESYRRSR